MVNDIRSEQAGFEPEEVEGIAFAESADRLLGLVAGLEADSPPQYYALTWGGHNRAALDEVTLVTITPTGAGRQLLWGELHEAQCLIAEQSADGASAGQRFVWCITAPRAIGSPVMLDDDRLLKEHGYTRLDWEHVVSELARRASTLGDYRALREAMERYGIDEAPAQLASSLESHMNSLAHQKRLSNGAVRDMLEVAYSYRGLISDLSPAIQGRAVSLLLRGISGRGGDPGSTEDVGDPAEAATTLEEALRNGLIPREHRTIDRILGWPEVYAYRFATELLHEHLLESSHSHPQRIFGSDRLDFIHDYITVIVRESTADPDIQSYLSPVSLPRYGTGDQAVQRQRLLRLVNGLSLLSCSDEETESSVMPYASGLSSIASTLEFVLQRQMGAGLDVSDEAFRRQCVEAVTKLLAQPIRQMGKSAVQEATRHPSGSDEE